MNDYVNLIGSARVLSALDASSDDYRIKVNSDDKEKTAFSTHRGLYEFMRMPFCLELVPPTFQRVMNVIFLTLKAKYDLKYMNNRVILCKRPKNRLERTKAVLHPLKDAGVALELKKCVFCTN